MEAVRVSMPKPHRVFGPKAWVVFGLILGVCGGENLQAQSLSTTTLTGLKFEQKLNAQVPSSLPFTDEYGKTVHLQDYLNQKPVILFMGYYECPMLCTLVLNGLVEAMHSMPPSVGRDFDIVCVSISPVETPALAMSKKRRYLTLYGRAGAAPGWHFLTGQEAAIKTLADTIGYQYAYDPSVKQYAHPSGFVVLTPGGKVAKYFFGVKFSTSALQAAIAEAGAKKIGSPVAQIIYLCFEHLPLMGKHSASIMQIVRVLGVLVVLVIAGYVGWSLLRERRKRQRATPQPATEGGQP